MTFPSRIPLSLLALFLLSAACGDAAYRLYGHAPPGAAAVSLLDSTAVGKIGVVKARYRAARDSVDVAAAARTDSLERAAEAAGEPVREARDRLAAARAAYRNAFEGIKRFRSFGGNRVFTDADVDVPTATLLNEVADRFYKGKAFSLETGREIRAFIRETLVPHEERAARARRALARRQRAQAAGRQALAAAREEALRERAALLHRYNERIRDVLFGATLLRAAVDSSGTYAFPSLRAGRYHLYVTSPEPQVVPLRLSAHSRRDLGPDPSGSPLLEGG